MHMRFFKFTTFHIKPVPIPNFLNFKINDLRLNKTLIASYYFIHLQLKAVKSFLSMRQHDSLHRYLRQIQKQILASHHLLEYCCAVNYFRPRARICTNRISVLSFCLSVLEDTIKTEKCDEKNLKKVVRFYDLVKVNTNSLMCEISNALSYVRPNIV